MSTRQHVHELCGRLNPTGIVSLIEQARGMDPSDALSAAETRLADIRIGGGAIAMHERNTWGEPTVPLAKLKDHEALLLTGMSLRAAQLAPRRIQILPAIARLDAILAREPDFFDEMLLELSRRYHATPSFSGMIQTHAEMIRSQEATLRTIDRDLFPEKQTGLLRGVKHIFGVGGDPMRVLRLVTGLVILDAKERLVL
jgi:hypothetical protein